MTCQDFFSASPVSNRRKISYKMGEAGHLMILEKESLVHLICRHCEFFKESDKDLECGAFKILKGLLDKGIITPEEIKDVLQG